MPVAGTSACYLFAGGGTGGHLTPGLAVAAELRRRDAECQVLFVGTDRPIECDLIAGADYEHVALPVEPSPTLRRNPLKFAWRNWQAYCRAQGLLEERQPCAVVGLGGFASVPAVLAASRRGIPTILLEQNAVPGRATRTLCRRASAVCGSFEGTARLLRSGTRVVVTGNPVRAGIGAMAGFSTQPASDDLPTLLVLGGSQGAESLNDAVAAVMESQLPQLAGWRIVHQTGPAQGEKIAQRYRTLGGEHLVQAFFDDMPRVYGSATLAVSRAGATTLAELACAGVPAILLPFRHAADDHQRANARAFETAGAALVIEHDRNPVITASRLASAVGGLAADASCRAGMREAMRRLARPDAARQVADVVTSLIADSALTAHDGGG